MLKKIICFAVFVLIGAAGVVQAQVSLTYLDSGIKYFSINIPDNWRVNVGADTSISELSEDEGKPVRLISTMPNDGMPLWFGMWVAGDIATIKDAKGYMNSLGLDLLTDVNITKKSSDTLNLMKVYSVSGTGKKEGELMDFHTAFFQISPGNVVVALYIGPPETTKVHGPELVQMIQSLRPVTQ